MALPEQVVNEARRADALIAGVAGQPPGTEQAPGQAAGEEAPAPTLNQQPQNPQPATVKTDQAGVEHDWKQRFTKLKSSHDATTHQQRQQIEQLMEEQRTLREQLAANEVNDLKADIDLPVSLDGVLTEQEVDLLGDENLAVITKIVNHAVSTRIAGVIEYQDKRQQAAESKREQQLTAEAEQKKRVANFKRGLTRQVSDWRELDEDPGFKTWVEEADEVSGNRRIDLMINAFQAHDIGRVAEFYNAYKATMNQPDPRDKQLLPDTGRSASPVPAAGMQQGIHKGKIWAAGEISEFYRLRSLGRFKGRESDARAIEADIFAAQKEGRVR